MGERTIVVCDVCGKPAAERVTIRIGDRSVQKDLCQTHLAELINGTRAARRGRRPALGETAKAPRPRARAARKPSTRKRPAGPAARAAAKT
jgi:hypothetical protein